MISIKFKDLYQIRDETFMEFIVFEKDEKIGRSAIFVKDNRLTTRVGIFNIVADVVNDIFINVIEQKYLEEYKNNLLDEYHQERISQNKS